MNVQGLNASNTKTALAIYLAKFETMMDPLRREGMSTDSAEG